MASLTAWLDTKFSNYPTKDELSQILSHYVTEESMEGYMRSIADSFNTIYDRFTGLDGTLALLLSEVKGMREESKALGLSIHALKRQSIRQEYLLDNLTERVEVLEKKVS